MNELLAWSVWYYCQEKRRPKKIADIRKWLESKNEYERRLLKAGLCQLHSGSVSRARRRLNLEDKIPFFDTKETNHD